MATPNLEQIPLYRYLTFNRFLETLDKGLFIPKASLFNDRWEAMVYWMHEYLQERETNIRLKDSHVSTPNDFCIPDTYKRIRQGMKEVYVSCWNGTDYECVAMWKLYGTDGNAVMLETNAKELTNAFDNFDNSPNKEWLACLIKLRYVLPGDWNYDRVFDGNEPLWVNGPQGGFSESFLFHCTYTGLHYKHISYSFENEYRLIAAHKDREERPNNGIVLPINKSSFITRVILQPGSPDAFEGIVRDYLKKLNFSNVLVEKSFLDELPP